MFRLAHPVPSIIILVMMGLQAFIALSTPPLPFNPLFFLFEDAGTIRMAQLTFWYLLLPAHTIEAVIAMVIAVRSKKHSLFHVFLWGLQTLVLGGPSLTKLIAINARGGAKKSA